MEVERELRERLRVEKLRGPGVPGQQQIVALRHGGVCPAPSVDPKAGA